MADEAQLNMDLILSYPITPYPLSILYTDGQPMRTSKNKLMKKLEEYQGKTRPILQDEINGLCINYLCKQ